jgi:hypothetical protein
MSRTLIDRNSDTGKRSSQTSMCEHCDECLTAGRSKLNGGFSRVADPGLKAAALAMSRRARSPRLSSVLVSCEPGMHTDTIRESLYLGVPDESPQAWIYLTCARRASTQRHGDDLLNV